MSLTKEFDWYLKNQDRLIKKYNRLFLAIKDHKIIGVFATYGEAFLEILKEYDPGSVLIQKCSSGSQDYAPNFKARTCLKNEINGKSRLKSF